MDSLRESLVDGLNVVDLVFKLLDLVEASLVGAFDLHLPGRLIMTLNQTLLKVLLLDFGAHGSVFAVFNLFLYKLDLTVAILNLLLERFEIFLIFFLYFPILER